MAARVTSQRRSGGWRATATDAGRSRRRPSFERTYRTYVDTYRTYAPPPCQVRLRGAMLRRWPNARRCPRTRRGAATWRWGELDALEQIKRDSEVLDSRAIAVGPFARLDAERRRRARRQDARRDHEPVRQPGRVPGRDDGAGARASATGSSRSSTRRRPTSRTPAPGSTPSSPASPRAGRSTAREPAVDYADAVGAVAERRALRDVERARQRAEHGRAHAVGRAARPRSAARWSTSACSCVTARRSTISRVRSRA